MRRILIVLLLIGSIGETPSDAAGRRRAVAHPSSGAAAPLALADSYSVSEGTTLTIAAPGVLANDTLNGAVIASFGPTTGLEQSVLGNAMQTARGGSINLSSGGSFTYTAASGVVGADTFRYLIRNAAGSSTGVVTIEVRPVEATAVGDSYTTPPENALNVPAPGVLGNDILAGGRIASFGARTGTEQTTLATATPSAQGGTISLNGDGSFNYTPPPTLDDGYGYSRPFTGRDAFLYMIQRGAVFSTALVDIAVEIPSTADYVVTTPGHYYAISGLAGENPPLQLKRGQTYTFEISASPVHPFAILDAPPGSVSNNNITSGRVTFTVPAAAQDYRYRCTTHGFGNVITTVD